MGNHRMLAHGDSPLGACCLVAAACSRPVGVGAHGTTGSIRVTHAVAWSAADVKAATVGMEIGNAGDVVRHAHRGDVARRGGDAAYRGSRGRGCAPYPCSRWRREPRSGSGAACT